MERAVLTAQSQKADYYHPGGDCWETTPQISFSLATRGRKRQRTMIFGVPRAVECLRARVTLWSPSHSRRGCSFFFGGCSCEAVTTRRGCLPVWLPASCCSSRCRREKS